MSILVSIQLEKNDNTDNDKDTAQLRRSPSSKKCLNVLH